MAKKRSSRSGSKAKKAAEKEPAKENFTEEADVLNNENENNYTSPETAEAVEAEVIDSEAQKLREELETQKDQFLRMAAEYDNFRKRTEKEKLATYDNAVAATVEAFLPVLDNFNLAMSSSAEVSDDFRKGLDMIQKQFETAFEKLKVSSFGERGDQFDPELHNAVSRTEDPEVPEDHIAQVYQKGYLIGDKIIRHAMVQVSGS